MISLERQDGSLVCERCLLAETPLARMRGLLGRAGLARGEGLLLRPASSIHMWFMRFPIDAVFLDGEQRVLKVVPGLAPWRLAGCRGAREVLELPAGEAARVGLAAGDRLAVRPAGREPAARAA
ncbi:MAG TPA: DUF192 domain-containing protein [Gaiellaceae bacterium]|nr:DUF192 domain-containing protein [Gaiellaceae bacterium]